MDLASIAAISTYKSSHCVTSIKITLKIYLLKFSYKIQTDAYQARPYNLKLFAVYRCVIFLQNFQHLRATKFCWYIFALGKSVTQLRT